MGSECEHFYGIEPKMFTLNRFYKAYLCRNQVNLAWLAGQVHDEKSAQSLARSGQLFSPLLIMYFRRFIKRRLEREQFYDSFEVTSGQFLAEERRNRTINVRDLAKVVLRPRKNAGVIMAGQSTSGIVTFIDCRGKQLKLILVGDQDVARLEQNLRACFGSIDVSDR